MVNGLNEVQGQKRTEVLKWLSGVDYPNNHYQARKGYTPGTGVWLLKHQNFRRWQELNGPACLWLKGNGNITCEFLHSA